MSKTSFEFELLKNLPLFILYCLLNVTIQYNATFVEITKGNVVELSKCKTI